MVAESQTNGRAYFTPGTLEYAAQQVENKANELLENGWQPSSEPSGDEKEGESN